MTGVGRGARRRAAVVAAFIGWLGASASAQRGAEKLTVRGPEPGIVKLGEVCSVQFSVEGDEAAPQLGAGVLPAVDGLRYRIGTPSRRESSYFVNGRTTRSVLVTQTLEIRPDRVGSFEIPSFSFNTGTRTQTVPPLRFEVVRDVRGQDLGFLELGAISKRVYVNEPIRFVVDYGIDRSVRLVEGRARSGQRYYDVEILAPWLDELEGVVPLEQAPPDDSRVTLVLNRALAQATYDPDLERGGRAFHHFTLRRSVLPTTPGKIELPAPVLRFAVETGRGRVGLFGERISGGSEDYFVYGEPLVLEVAPLPTEGRPASFTGAVGRFALTASVTPSRVKVGDSVKLTLRVEGAGNLEFLDPPRLGALEGLHQLGVNENRDDASVTVTYDLTPLAESVTAIPSIAWSFFDTTPGVERYVEVATEPIALTVDPLPESASLESLPGEDTGAVVAGVDDIFDAMALDGEAVRLPTAAGGGDGVGRAWFGVLALGPWLVAALLLWFVRRRVSLAADVDGRRARGAAKEFARRLAGADVEPVDALVGYVADRCGWPPGAVIGPDLADRLVASGVDVGLARELQIAVEQGIAARYGGGAPLTRERAEQFVASLEQRGRAGVAAPVVLWFAVAFGGLAIDDVRGQGGGEATRALEAYRAGDYAAAAAGFERAVAAAADVGIDARVLYNLGNSLFRLDRPAEALAAWERARLAMPRDERLLANIALVERRLDLGSAEGEPFLTAVANLRDRFTRGELAGLALLCNALAAALLLLGRGRRCRALGAVVAIPAALLIVELGVLGPARPPLAIVVADDVPIVAEPRSDLEPLYTVRAGVRVRLLGEGPEWCRVELRDRSGWVPRDVVTPIRSSGG